MYQLLFFFPNLVLLHFLRRRKRNGSRIAIHGKVGYVKTHIERRDQCPEELHEGHA